MGIAAELDRPSETPVGKGSKAGGNEPSKDKYERARDRGEVVLIGAEVEKDLAEALGDCVIKERRSKRAIITLALERYLKDAGVWPRRARKS